MRRTRRDALTRALKSVLVVPLTTNLSRANQAGTALVAASPDGLPATSVALAFQLRAIPKSALVQKARSLSRAELAELELATDEALGRVEPENELRYGEGVWRRAQTSRVSF
jgi:mRNA-degrading endonuclease toxin of MazEF toxin-antitoxin module